MNATMVYGIYIVLSSFTRRALEAIALTILWTILPQAFGIIIIASIHHYLDRLLLNPSYIELTYFALSITIIIFALLLTIKEIIPRLNRRQIQGCYIDLTLYLQGSPQPHIIRRIRRTCKIRKIIDLGGWIMIILVNGSMTLIYIWLAHVVCS